MWIDKVFNSSLIVYILLFGLIIHIYLKKTNQTFLEMVKRITAFVRGLQEDDGQ